MLETYCLVKTVKKKKRILEIIILSLIFCNISYSKINNAYYNELYDACMLEAMKSDLGYTITKNYCKCSADHFDKNYNDDSLIELVEGEGGAIYNDIVSFVGSKCRKKVGLE